MRHFHTTQTQQTNQYWPIPPNRQWGARNALTEYRNQLRNGPLARYLETHGLDYVDLLDEDKLAAFASDALSGGYAPKTVRQALNAYVRAFDLAARPIHGRRWLGYVLSDQWRRTNVNTYNLGRSRVCIGARTTWWPC